MPVVVVVAAAVVDVAAWRPLHRRRSFSFSWRRPYLGAADLVGAAVAADAVAGASSQSGAGGDRATC